MDNMDEIKVSIICLVYNHEKYIKDCLDGFINQKTNFKYEVLIHDDASTDNTANIIREYEKKYPEIIKPIYQTENQYSKHLGIINTYLMPKASGKYVAFCEGDDYWIDENKLQLQYDALENNKDCYMCVSDVKIVDALNNDLNKTFPEKEYSYGILSSEQIIKSFTNDYFQTSSYFLRLDKVKESIVNPPEYLKVETGVGDIKRMLYFASIGNIYYIKKTLSCYRVGVPGSWTERVRKNKSKENIILHYQQSIKMYDLFNEDTNYKFNDIIKEVVAYNTWLICFYSNDKREYYSKKYKKFRKNQSFKTRVKFFLKLYFPWILKILKKDY